MPKRARSETPAPQIVVNITNYFAAAPAPTPPPAEGPKRPFATTEANLLKPKNLHVETKRMVHD